MGPEYLLPEDLERLRSRSVGAKQILASREFACGLETHECVFGVLALESEPIDPRLGGGSSSFGSVRCVGVYRAEVRLPCSASLGVGQSGIAAYTTHLPVSNPVQARHRRVGSSTLYRPKQKRGIHFAYMR
jgi:hypothetical protein